MKRLTANFYPDMDNNPDAKHGYLGKADITIGNAIRLNNISVFRKEDGININFPEFGDGASYVVPRSAEAYAALRDVVAKAVENEKHFGFSAGQYGMQKEDLVIDGKLVDEPYADGRFSVAVADLCTLYGITTRVVDFKDDHGKDRSFVAVNMPTLYSYEKDGEKQYQTAFEGRISVWKDEEGKENSRNYAQFLEGLVRSERKEKIKERKPSLEDQMKGAQARQATQQHTDKESPMKEPAR